MRSALLFASAAALLGLSGTASAQAYGSPYYYGQPQAYSAPHLQPGQRLPYRMLTPSRELADYYRYRLSTPPRGSAYYRADNGDVVLAQRSSGVIASVWPNVLAPDPRGYGYQERRPDWGTDWGADDGDAYSRDAPRGQPGRQPYWQRAQPGPSYYPDRGANEPDTSYYGGYGQPSYGQQPYGYAQPNSSRQGQVFTAPNGRRYTVGSDGVSRWVD
jgi:hypothetical protein